MIIVRIGMIIVGFVWIVGVLQGEAGVCSSLAMQGTTIVQSHGDCFA